MALTMLRGLTILVILTGLTTPTPFISSNTDADGPHRSDVDAQGPHSSSIDADGPQNSNAAADDRGPTAARDPTDLASARQRRHDDTTRPHPPKRPMRYRAWSGDKSVENGTSLATWKHQKGAPPTAHAAIGSGRASFLRSACCERCSIGSGLPSTSGPCHKPPRPSMPILAHRPQRP